MRAFIALQLQPAVVRELTLWRESVQRAKQGLAPVAAEDDCGLLRDAQALLTSALQRIAQIEPAARIFFPHVTVARVKSGFKVRPSPLQGPLALEFSGARVTLFQSDRGYRALHTVEL